MEGVIHVLKRFRDFERHEQRLRFDAGIKAGGELSSTRVVLANQVVRGMIEVVYGGALAQELRIEHDAKVLSSQPAGSLFEQRYETGLSATGQNRAANHNNGITFACGEGFPNILADP